VRTETEKRIAKSRRQQDGVLVPLLNELLKSPIGVDTPEDAEFLHILAMKQVRREQQRVSGEGVYSPSGLASCLRRVYLGKNWKKLGLERVELPAIEPHFYFLSGDFIHLKWQFALYRLSLLLPDFWLVDCEIPVMSKRKDHGGTIDALCMWQNEPLVVDVKGLKVRGFIDVDEGRVPHDYRIQLTDYMMLFNAGLVGYNASLSPLLKETLGEIPKVKRGILLVENKGGPDYRHPAALTEQVISLKDNLPEVRARLEVLRAHEEASKLPDIECVTTQGIQFNGCPFAGFCKEEVQAVERRRKDAENRDPKQYRLARPKRSDRPRQSRSKR
jgi:hypothetical protein